MGKAERENPQSSARKEIGAFNVSIRLAFLDGIEERFNVKRWIHQGNDLALSISDDYFRVVNCRALKYFEILPQEEIQ